MSIEAMKQWAEDMSKAYDLTAWGHSQRVAEILKQTRNSIRTAIAEAEKQEPRCAVIVEVFGKDWRLDYMSLPVGKHRLYTQNYVYTTPPAAQQGMTIDASAPIVMTPHPAFAHRSAAQRQPLTDAEVLHLWAGDTPRPVLGKNKVLAFARAIEAAHGIGEKK
jgi:hypothetical protein